MHRIRPLTLLAAAWLLATATSAQANALANGRLQSVEALGGACLAGPLGGSVQFWEVEPGQSYKFTITNITDCAHGGTDPQIYVRINSSSVGNTDVVATNVGPGTYEFTFPIPANARCTMPLFYCVQPGESNTGLMLRRRDGEDFQAHLRMASFGPQCSSPTALNGGECLATPTVSRTWSQVKQIYR
jgi:hypothetical protein